MNDLISPKYQMKLVKSVSEAIWAEFPSYEQVRYYIDKWHEDNYDPNGFNNDYWENFKIIEKENKKNRPTCNSKFNGRDNFTKNRY